MKRHNHNKGDIVTQIQRVDETRLKREFLDEAFAQRLPSEKDFEWSNPNDKANSSCRLKEDARVKAYDKSQGVVREYSGKEFNAHMMEAYGTDVVQYNAKEPDFTPFEQEFSKQKVDKYLKQRYGEKSGREAKGNALGHVEVSKIDSERYITQGEATKIVADQLGLSGKDVRDYMQANNITWHECGDGKTVRAIPTEVNGIYKHTGGIALKTDMQAAADISNRSDNNPKLGEEIHVKEFARRNKTELLHTKKEIKEKLKPQGSKLSNTKKRGLRNHIIKHKTEIKSLQEHKDRSSRKQAEGKNNNNAFSRAKKNNGSQQVKSNAFTKAKNNKQEHRNNPVRSNAFTKAMKNNEVSGKKSSKQSLTESKGKHNIANSGKKK